MFGMAFAAFGWLKDLAKVVLSSELGRMVLAIAIAYFVGFSMAKDRERAACQARIERSEAEAKRIDLQAAQSARETALRQMALSEIRQREAERKVKEISDAYAKECALSPDAVQRLERLLPDRPTPVPQSPTRR